MAYDHRAIIEAQYAQINAERAQANAELEAGRLQEDQFSTMSAADRIIELDVKRAALDRIAQNYVVSQHRPQGNQFGLSPDEIDIAHSVGASDPNLTNQQREQTYAQNKDRLRHMRATGQYRDDQGTVRR